MNEWINQSMNKSMNEWMNEWTNEWINEMNYMITHHTAFPVSIFWCRKKGTECACTDVVGRVDLMIIRDFPQLKCEGCELRVYWRQFPYTQGDCSIPLDRLYACSSNLVRTKVNAVKRRKNRIDHFFLGSRSPWAEGRAFTWTEPLSEVLSTVLSAP